MGSNFRRNQDLFTNKGLLKSGTSREGRLAQLVRALARQARGHWFESSIAHFSVKHLRIHSQVCEARGVFYASERLFLSSLYCSAGPQERPVFLGLHSPQAWFVLIHT